MNILVADDQAALLKTYTIFLRSENHEVYTAETAEQAFELFHRHSIDLAIVDFDFGDSLTEIRNGIELILKTRKSGIWTPIILNTSYPGEAESYIGRLSEEEKDQLGRMKLYFKLTIDAIREAIEATFHS